MKLKIMKIYNKIKRTKWWYIEKIMNKNEIENKFILPFLYRRQFYDVCNYILNNEKEYYFIQNILQFMK